MKRTLTIAFLIVFSVSGLWGQTPRVPPLDTILKCDTLVTAVGLLPERELALPLMQDGTPPDWLGFAGNCERIHEIVDAVTVQALALGEAAIRG